LAVCGAQEGQLFVSENASQSQVVPCPKGLCRSLTGAVAACSIYGVTPQSQAEPHQHEEPPKPRGPHHHWWFWALLLVIVVLVLIYGGAAGR